MVVSSQPVFVSLDGVDGAGKSTQIELLERLLLQSGHKVNVFRDPGGTSLGDAVREILLHKQDIKLGMTTEMLLYMASRAQLVEELIQPCLARGESVICDRYLLANIVYQGHAGGLDTHLIREVGKIATQGISPQVTIILDLAPKISLERIGGKPDRLESRGLAYMELVREGFLRESKGDPTIHVVDASRSIEVIHAEIAGLITQSS